VVRCVAVQLGAVLIEGAFAQAGGGLLLEELFDGVGQGQALEPASVPHVGLGCVCQGDAFGQEFQGTLGITVVHDAEGAL